MQTASSHLGHDSRTPHQDPEHGDIFSASTACHQPDTPPHHHHTVGVIKICTLVFREVLSLGCIILENICAHHQEDLLRISKHPQLAQGCLYLGPGPSVLDKSFFAESVLTSYNFLASLQIIFNLENGQIKFLDNFFYLLSSIYSRQERVNDANCSVDNSGPALPAPPRPSVRALQSPS